MHYSLAHKPRNCASGASWKVFLGEAAAHTPHITMCNAKRRLQRCEARRNLTLKRRSCLEWWIMLQYVAVWWMNLENATLKMTEMMVLRLFVSIWAPEFNVQRSSLAQQLHPSLWQQSEENPSLFQQKRHKVDPWRHCKTWVNEEESIGLHRSLNSAELNSFRRKQNMSQVVSSDISVWPHSCSFHFAGTDSHRHTAKYHGKPDCHSCKWAPTPS